MMSNIMEVEPTHASHRDQRRVSASTMNNYQILVRKEEVCGV